MSDFFLNKRAIIFTALFFSFIHLFGLLYFYESVLVNTHDNLDSVYVWLKLLKDNNLFFANGGSSVPFLGGISRFYLPSQLQLMNFLYFLFDPLFAHFFSYILKVALGTFSFWLLANYLFKNRINKTLVFVVAISFALLPGYENLYFAQCSIPLVLYFFIKAVKDNESKYYFGLLLYPVLSELPRYGMFILAMLGLYLIYCILKKDEKYKRVIFSIFCLTIGYVITEYHFFSAYLLSDTESLRKTLITPESSVVKTFFVGLFTGQYHAQSNHLFVILPTVLYVVYQEIKNGRFLTHNNRLLISLLIILFFNALVYGLQTSHFIQSVISIIPPLKGWNFGRLIWFNPFLWHLLFLICLSYLVLYQRKVAAHVLLLAQLSITLIIPSYGNDFSRTLACNLLADYEISWCNRILNYHDFFSEEEFSYVKREIGYEGEAVLAFGMHPSILSFNGFYTLDGYHNAYSLKYKQKFRKIISPILDESKKHQEYFDNWGGRAYLFSSSMDNTHRSYRQYSNNPVKLTINSEAAIELGAKYLISLYELDLTQQTRLIKVLEYKEESSPYNIRVYEFN